MRSFLTSQNHTPRHPTSSSAGPSTQAAATHFASSRRLEKARATSPTPSTSSSIVSSGPTPSTPKAPAESLSKAFPRKVGQNNGVEFPVDWNNIHYANKLLVASRVGYRVRDLRQISGKAKSSNIWRYGADLVYIDAVGKRTRLWLCKTCHLKGLTTACKAVNSTAHIATHLQKEHSIGVVSGQLFPTGRPGPLDPWAASRAAGSAFGGSHTPWQETSLLRAYVDWVILQDVSFNSATSAEVRSLIAWNRLDLLEALPSSTTTLSSYIVDGLKARKAKVRLILNSAVSSVALSVDVWTSPNHFSFLAVVAHFVDINNQPQDLLIGFKNLLGDHTGANQAIAILSVINDYNIATQFSCFVGDNATNNDAKLIAGLNLHPDISITFEHRIRCAGHIINLVVKALIYGNGVSKFEEELAQAAPQDQFQLYRKHGIVGKLHNFVNAVLASHKRRELFTTIQTELGDEDPLWRFGSLHLIQDGGIRWHSVYRMLLRCHELRDPISRFTRRWRALSGADDVAADEDGDEEDKEELDYDPLADALSDDEWDDVKELADFLEPFYQMTLRLEGNVSTSGYGSLWQTLVNLQHLWRRLHKVKDAVAYKPNNSYIKNATGFAIQKLTSYFIKLVMDQPSSPYCVATALNPQLRLLWFQGQWSAYPAWYKKAERSLKDVFQRYVDAEEEEVIELDASALRRRKTPGGKYHDEEFEETMAVNLHLQTNSRAHKKARTSNELTTYFDNIRGDLLVAQDEDPIYGDPMTWWHYVGKKQYPILYKVALDYLSIPATSCECERCFSKARRTISTDRNLLSPATIEALQLQRNWIQNKAIRSELNELTAHISARGIFEDMDDDLRCTTPVTPVTAPFSYGAIE